MSLLAALHCFDSLSYIFELAGCCDAVALLKYYVGKILLGA
jgi:hypothetical protein